MTLQEIVSARYSVRAYRLDPIPQDVLARVLEAFRLAPTAANKQPIGAVLLPTASYGEALRRIYDKDWFAEQPPMVIAVCADREAGWHRRDGMAYADVDATIAMDHLILAATAEGLGTCWIGAFDPEAAREVLGVPEGVEPIAFTPLGYPADSPRAKRRKALEALVFEGRWPQA